MRPRSAVERGVLSAFIVKRKTKNPLGGRARANRFTFPYCAYGAGGVGNVWETKAAVPTAPFAASSSITEALGAGVPVFAAGRRR